TAPTWMKTNKSGYGGKLDPIYYSVYADYLVKYVKAMKTEGITIDAITPQNEPLNAFNNPSMEMTATEQTEFIKKYLGPKFMAASLTTKIIIYDHNADHPEYPITVLNDAAARQYVDGSAFHLYAGPISALSSVHAAYPDKNIYFTEQFTSSTGSFSGDLAWHFRNLIIGAPRNWSRNVLEWNLASDPNYNPHLTGGCSDCKGALTLNGDNITRNVSYYIIGHASKFVPPGSVRVESNVPGNLQNVAYVTPSGKKVLIVLNDSNTSQAFNIMFKGKLVTTTLDAGAVGTYTW
ncbi:MAG: glucosylceramidase, partial [Chitinophagaceae bacterium]|nr:glucosylceramidase [Chitinophagaceae bacterium]